MTAKKKDYDTDEVILVGDWNILKTFGSIFGLSILVTIPIMLFTTEGRELYQSIINSNSMIWLISSIIIFMLAIELLSSEYVRGISKKTYTKITIGATLAIKVMMVIPSIIVSGIIVGTPYVITKHYDKCIKFILNTLNVVCIIVIVLLIGVCFYGFVWLNNKWFNRILVKQK